MNTELRTLKSELRAEADFVLVGKALSYNMPSPDDQLMPGCREIIAPGCFRASIAAGGYQGDVLCLINHDQNRVVGRLSNGTLNLYDAPDALRFRCQLDRNNPDHAGAYASVKRGDISECSFAFAAEDADFVNDTDSKGEPCVTRVVRKAHLIDVSAVSRPFYSLPGSTEVQARARETRAAFGRAHAPKAVADLKESIAKFRKLAFLDAKFRGVMRDGAVGGTGQGDEMALVRGHLELAHQFAECANAMCDTARGIMDSWDEDWDNDQDDDRAAKTRCSLRDSFTAAHEMIGDACNGLAACRMHKRLAKPYVPKKK